jgi:hypothetical protein
MTTAKVTNAPDQIYLCYGDIDEDVDHNKWRNEDYEIAWCENQPENSDIKYIRADIVDVLRAELAKAKSKIKELEESALEAAEDESFYERA